MTSTSTRTAPARAIALPSVVRRFGSDKTHVLDVVRTTEAVIFGKFYERPQDGVAACGVTITDGVVMLAGTAVRCTACRHITGIEAQPETSGYAAHVERRETRKALAVGRSRVDAGGR